MTLQQLYYFRTVAEVRHFTKAATKLMVTQPSLSHAINELESELGICLFDRSSRNVTLTKYGELFLDYVDRGLRLLDEGQEKLYDFIDPSHGTVALGYVSSLEAFVPYLVTRFYSETQGMHTLFQFYQMPNADIKAGLLSGAADLGIGTLNGDRCGLNASLIGEHTMVLLVSDDHPLATQDSVDLAALGQERLITYDRQCDIRTYIDQVFHTVGLSPSIALEATHDTIIYSSVAANYGVALVPAPLGVTPYHVKSLRIENQIPKRELSLMWKEMRYTSPAVCRFRDFILSHQNILDAYRAELRHP